MLLSATPINNSYLDLAHQLSLKDTHITINGVPLNPITICKRANEITKKAQDNIKDTSVFNDNVNKPDTINSFDQTLQKSNARPTSKSNCEFSEIILPPDYYKLCNLIFSRSAEEIATYLASLNKSLPKKAINIEKLSSIPTHIHFNIDSLLEVLGVNESQHNSLSFCIYDPYNERYLPSEIIEELKSDKLANLGDYSTPRGFLCMSLIKALESSIDAFSSILDKIIAYHTNFLNKHGSIKHLDFDVDFEINIDDDNVFPQRLQAVIDGKDGYSFVDKLTKEFYMDLESDLEKLYIIKSKLNAYNSKRDFPQSQKFKALKSLIDSTPIKNEKLIIFTESIVTAKALTNALKDTFKHSSDIIIESITGHTSQIEFSNFKRRFSPNSLNYTLKEGEREIDILVATDCLSEGQNLQDCANLLNWDIAFNPVRAIQRIGRIWRIGSKHNINHITHYFPNMETDAYIDLEAKLRYKLEAANSATALENPFLQEQQEQRYNRHKDLREKQLKAMESEFIAIEQESSTFINLANLFSSFVEEPKSRLRDGIFSIVLNDAKQTNLLFALLQDKSIHNAKDISKSDFLYPCIYDISKQTLLPSVSLNDKKNNLSQILAFNSSIKPQEAFSQLESITKDYSDISTFKVIFKNLTDQLNAQITTREKQIAENASRDGGLFPKKPPSKPFKLIAWLLINPDFTKLQGYQNAR